MKLVQFVLPFGRSRPVRSGNLPTVVIRASGCAAVGLFCLFTASRAWSADCVLPPDGLVAWWPGEGNANDGRGTNDGILSGGITFAAGEVRQAFDFNGVDSDVRMPASASLDVGVGSGFTIELWINPADTSSRPLVEWYKPGAFGVHFWANFPSPGLLFANLFDTDGYSHTMGSIGGPLQSNTFQHVALTFDKVSGTARFFFNGLNIREVNLGTFIPQTAFDLHIGCRPGAESFKGLIDEATLYGRPLSATEIAAIYNAGSAGKCGWPTITRQPQNQVGYWGKNITFTLAADGLPPLSFQWFKNGSTISGATDTSLVLTNLQIADAAAYSVTVSNFLGSTNSSNAYLTMNPAGVSLALYPGIAIDGVVSQTYGIQSTSDLSNTNSWVGVTNITLTVPTQLWYDSQPATQPQRYYRVVPGPISVP